MLAKPKLQQRQAQPYAAIRTQVPIPFGKYLPPLWDQVHDWLENQSVRQIGPAMIRYLTTDMSKKLDIEVGFAIEKPIPGTDSILVDVLPAGRYATLLYTGSYKGKGIYKATVALLEWAKENHITWKTSTRKKAQWWHGRVEWYLTDPDKEVDPKKYQTELAFLTADK